jgi:hypothetical protein
MKRKRPNEQELYQTDRFGKLQTGFWQHIATIDQDIGTVRPGQKTDRAGTMRICKYDKV